MVRKYSTLCALTSGGKSLKCDYSNLATHTKIYTDAKLFKCDLCDDEFTQFGSLTIDQQSHAGIKPLKWCFCGKVFSTSGQLIISKRIHSGTKPFKGDLCDKGFT